jgi:hypothetical protein
MVSPKGATIMHSPDMLLRTITYGAIIVLYAISLPSLIASWKAKTKLNGIISNENDLGLLLACARKSKYAAGILLMVFLPGFLIAIALISRELFSYHFRILCYSMFPIWILSLIAERPLKKLKIAEGAFALEEKYQRILIDWAKPGLRIKQ